MAMKFSQRKSVYAIALSAALVMAAPAPVLAASPFGSFFLNYRALTLTWQAQRYPGFSANQVNRINNRNPDRALEIVTLMYARNPEATNNMLSSLLETNPTGGAELVDALHQNNVPVSPT